MTWQKKILPELAQDVFIRQCHTYKNRMCWPIIEPRHETPNNVVCATSKASDQPTHIRSMIRAFASRLNIL